MTSASMLEGWEAGWLAGAVFVEVEEQRVMVWRTAKRLEGGEAVNGKPASLGRDRERLRRVQSIFGLSGGRGCCFR